MKTTIQTLREEFQVENRELDLHPNSIYAKADKRHLQIKEDCVRKGKADGALDIPKGEETALFESQLKPTYQAIDTELLGRSTILMERIRAKQVDTEAELSKTLLGKLHEKTNSIKANFARASLLYGRHNQETYALKNLLELRIKGGLHLVIGFLIILEVPLNRLTLEPLGITGGVSWGISIVVSISLALISHFLGLLLKRKAKTGSTLMVLLLFAISLPFVGLRAAYSLAVAKHGPDVTLAEAWESLQMLDVIFSIHFVVTLGILLLLILPCIILSYFSHDSVEGFEVAYCEYKFELPKIEKQLTELMDQEKRLSQANGTPSYVTRLFAELGELKEMYSVLDAKKTQLKQYLDCLYKEAVLTYRYHNENEREQNGGAEIPYLWNFPPDNAIEYPEPAEK